MLAILKDDKNGGKEVAEVEFHRSSHSPKRSKEDYEWASDICEHLGEIILNTKSLMIIGEGESGEMFVAAHINEKADKFSKKFKDNEELNDVACIAQAASMIHSLAKYIADKYDEDIDDFFEKIMTASKIVEGLKADGTLRKIMDEIEKISDSNERYERFKKLLKNSDFRDLVDLDLD